MIGLTLPARGTGPLRVLCLGAHADDIEIGCGGTLLTLLGRAGRLAVQWIVFSATPERAGEAQRSANALLGNRCEQDVEICDFQDGIFPHQLPAIKAVFERVKQRSKPDLILTHAWNDSHQDHNTIATLTSNTFRDHLLLGYEVPKYDGDLGRPNAYVHLSEQVARQKAEAIYDAFPSQQHRRWFDPETFLALARLRGIECNAEEGYAEAFYATKMVMAL